MNVPAVFFALLAGLLFGIVAHVQKSALKDTEVSLGALISVATMAAVFWALSPFVIEWQWFYTRAAIIFAVCGIIFPAVSQRLQVASVVHVGPALTSAMGSFAPLFAVVLAVAFLDEQMNLQGSAGMALMLAGLLVSAIGPGRGVPRAFPLMALLFPLGASLARGVMQPTAKFGFAEVDSPFFATLVMSTVATCVLFVWTLKDRSNRPLRQTRTGNLYFVLNGFLIGGGILSLQLGISYGSVSLAAPLSSTSPLWTLLLGVLFFRNEQLTWRHLVMALLVVAGSALVVTR